MLQLFVYGNKYSGYLDLPEGASLDMELLSELFDEDLTLGAYSLPVAVPWTDNNKKILGFVEMINSLAAAEQLYWRCHVYNNGVPEMPDAKLTFLEFGGSFNYDKGSYRFSISGNKGLFGSLIANKTLRDITIDKISYDVPSRDFATAVMKPGSGSDHYPYMKFAPVAILDFFDTERPDYNNEFLVEDLVNHQVITGGGDDDWVFGRPTTGDNTIAAAPGDPEYVDHRTIPFFTYKFIIQKLFAQFGYTVQGEWLVDPAWDDAVMFNNLALEKYTADFLDVANEILPAKHLPKKSIGAFLRDFNMFFNCKMSFKTGNNVSIDYRKSSLQSSKVMDVTKLANRTFLATPTDYRAKGFTLAFTFDSADSYPSERIKEIDASKVVATVDRVADLATLVIGRPFVYNELVYVKAENQYYSYSNGIGPDAWEYYSEKLFDYTVPGDGQGNDGYKYETAIAPMVTHILYDDLLDKLVNKDLVAAAMPGSYFNKKFLLVENPFDTRIFFIKRMFKSGNILPVSFVESKDITGFQRVPKSLSWYGDDGLYEYVWKEWLEFLRNTRSVKIKLSLNQKQYGDLLQTDKVRIDGITFLPRNIVSKIPLRDEVEAETFRL